ncbi:MULTISPECIES: two-component system sensor histidine kinase NtrB [Prosthecochloris]|uniref:histidine kinase n=1 Tax=Prosthecochloris vibrioformis TaxID=1098 RepID=A0A5C4S2J3_PROVB|nr:MULTISPECIES: ATP-binding protein [Prosthecochloris]ANT64968.1 Wide host range VirA protein [Prosthecochloris sp. CIB 2401]TNJ36961.1 PAS domain-containing protein [Prosthecochloris vibrioformis]
MVVRPEFSAPGLGGTKEFSGLVREGQEETLKIMRRMIDAMGGCVSLKDHRGKYLHVNKAFADLLGLQVEEIAGKTDFDFFPEPEAHAYRSAEREVMDSREHDDRAWDVTLTSGRSVFLVHRAPVFDEGQRVFGVLSTYVSGAFLKGEEMTAREELEKRLHESQKLEAVGRFAGTIAHDMNNLLTPILACSTLLLDAVDEKDSAYRELMMIRQAGARARDMVERLLAFSNNRPLDMQKLELNGLVQQFSDLLEATLPEGVSISYSFIKVPLVFNGDRVQIEQVLMNLLVNACKAMPGGGRISISTCRVGVHDLGRSGLPSGVYACIHFSDTGVGIPQDVLPHIFEPFFTTGAGKKGSGLGLATVYWIVQQHQGFINVSSKEGEGAVFTIFLPLAKGGS